MEKQYICHDINKLFIYYKYICQMNAINIFSFVIVKTIKKLASLS